MQPWKLDWQTLCCDLWIERLSDFTGLGNTTVQTPSLDKLFLNCSINIQIIEIDVCLQQEQYVCAHTHTHRHLYSLSPSFGLQECTLQKMPLYPKLRPLHLQGV